MKVLATVFIILFLTLFAGINMSFRNLSCGIDKTHRDFVSEGEGTVEPYPWLGYLVYPTKKQRFTTAVILVTKQVVLGTASEIDKLPKGDFRWIARVVLGKGCLGPQYRVKEYSYHPEFTGNTFSALAMIQLDVEGMDIETLRPICPPPSALIDPEFYAITLSDDCDSPRLHIYKMKYVEPSQCKTYYRKSGLDFDSLWPTHTACARAERGGECVWRSGTGLLVYQGRRWHLVGFGVYGPGCEAPARFLDYGRYHQWVRSSILRIGKPTITRVGSNELVLRRSLSHLQRYGHCDLGEMKAELYTDHTSIKPHRPGLRRIRYNVTIYANIEYSCVVFRAHNFNPGDKKPQLRLRRWCAGTLDICSDFQHLEIDFYVEITFYGGASFDLKAYGTEIKAIDPRKSMLFLNSKTKRPPIPSLKELQDVVKRETTGNDWYGSNLDESILELIEKNKEDLSIQLAEEKRKN